MRECASAFEWNFLSMSGLLGLECYSKKKKKRMLFRFSIPLLILCPVGLSISESGMLKSSTIIVELSISPFNSVSFASCILRSMLLVHICL